MTRLARIVCAAAVIVLPPSRTLSAGPPVRIGSKAFTESVILAEMLKTLGESAGVRIEHRAELGGTQILWNALRAGEIDAYPDYKGTILRELLADLSIRDDVQLVSALRERGVLMLAPFGFNNRYALALRKPEAERLGLATLSDLAAHPDAARLKFALSDEFLGREDGWPGLQRAYGLPGGHVRGMEHNLTYRAIETGAADVIDVYTTDAEIRFYGLAVLDDDRGYFPSYEAVLLYREELGTLQPHLVRTWRGLEGRISTEQMIELNARVKLDRQPESRVAADFLRSTLGLDVAAEPPPRPAWLTVAERIAASTVEHLFLVGVSLAAAVAAGVPLGVVAHRRPRLGAGILALVGMIQTIPSLAVLVFMIPLLGLGAAPAVAALFLYTLLPIVRGTVSGLAQIPGPLIESAQVLGLAGWSRLRLIELPLASPSILSGIKTAAVINVGTATIGALIGAGGYGQVILTGIRLADHGLLLQGAVPAAALALAVQSAFNAAERFVIPAGLRAARPRA